MRIIGNYQGVTIFVQEIYSDDKVEAFFDFNDKHYSMEFERGFEEDRMVELSIITIREVKRENTIKRIKEKVK